MHKADDFTTTQLNIINAVESLPRKQREVILLYDVHRLSVWQIARALCISENRAKKRLDHARLCLQNILIERL